MQTLDINRNYRMKILSASPSRLFLRRMSAFVL